MRNKISLISIIFIFKSVILEPLKIHFTQKSPHSKSNLYEYLKNYHIYTEILIGTPSQKIETKLTMEYSPFSIKSKEIEGKYDENASSTFSKSKSYIIDFYMQKFKQGYYSTDIMKMQKLNGKELEVNVSYILATKLEYKRELPYGQIGLKMEDISIVRDQLFISNLKKKDYINSYTFCFEFKNDDEGDIIIGEYPHQYNKNYNQKYYHNTQKADSNGNWKFSFDNISWNNQSFNLIKDVKIYIDLGIIEGTKQYREFLEEKYLNISKCERNLYSKDSLFYYTCPSSLDITKFPPLQFYSKDLNFTFVLDHNDLFIKDNDKYLFLITFGNYRADNWVFGRLFLKKYKLIFNIDKKTIGFYSDNITNKKKGNLIIWIFVFILGLIIFGLIYLIYKKSILLRRKKRANEIFDEYDYTPQINEVDDKFGING